MMIKAIVYLNDFFIIGGELVNNFDLKVNDFSEIDDILYNKGLNSEDINIISFRDGRFVK